MPADKKSAPGRTIADRGQNDFTVSLSIPRRSRLRRVADACCVLLDLDLAGAVDAYVSHLRLREAEAECQRLETLEAAAEAWWREGAA